MAQLGAALTAFRSWEVRAMGDIGRIERVVIVEPVESPVPAEKTPEPVREPEPVPEKVGA